MKKARSPGFTIIEVLIVLTVTGLLFLSVAALISGRTNQTEFDQASRAFQQQMQDAINQVEAGTYTGTSGSSDYTCTAGNPIQFGVGGTGQGTNSDCIFIGDVIEFGLDGKNEDGVNTYTLAGDRLQQPTDPNPGEEATSLSNAHPRVVMLGTGQPDVTPSLLEYGLHVYTANGKSSMNYDNSGSLTPIGAFAIVYSFASYNGGNIVSGSQQVNVVPLGSSQLGEDQTTLESQVLSQLANPLTSPDQSSGMQVTICAQSATTNQYALVTIGGTNNGSSNNGQLGVTLSILGKSNGSTCP
jgi:prepilin-type N-terminal cleavage/methylation domain-containing protein